MVTLRVKTVVYEQQDFESDEVMPLRDAAEQLGVSLQTVISAMDRGRLTELVDPDAVHPFRDRRFALVSEIEEEGRRRDRAAGKWRGKAVD